MNYQLLASAMAAALGGLQGSALAEPTVNDRMERLEQRLHYLEQRVQSQDQVIRDRDREIAALRGAGPDDDTGGNAWFDRIEVGGVVEVEASYVSPEGGDDESDLTLATVELGIAAQVTDWVGAEVALLYEDDGETELDVDVARITLAPPDGPWFVTAGQFYQPFGVFDSNMVSDPLTLELGEIRESAVAAGFAHGGWSGTVYVFNGSNSKAGGADDNLDNFGLTLGYAAAGDGYGFSGALGYLNDIGDSDTLQDAVDAGIGNKQVPDYVSGWFASATLEAGDFTLIGEYVAAREDFAPGVLDGGPAAAPAAWNLELGYAFALAGRGAVAAVGYQGTEEAEALDLPEQRVLAALSVEIFKQTSLSFEWARDQAYDGSESDSFTGQLAVAF